MLFNKTIEFVANILAYIKQIDFLYFINNSEEELIENTKSFFASSKIEVINNNKNLGVAFVNSQVERQKIIDDFNFLFIIDQYNKASEIKLIYENIIN